MSILPLSTARVSNLLTSDVATQSIESVQEQLLNVQNELSTGLKVSQPSDDPGAASVIMQLQKTLGRRQAYATNLTTANSQLSEVDSTLGSLTDLLQQAQSIASANVGSDVTDQQRQGAAAVVQSIFSQALSNANTQFNGTYLFGGDLATQQPFVPSGGGVQFVGSNTLLQNQYDDTTSETFQVSGAAVFGALSTRVQGTADITPSVSAQTRLIDLRGATGSGVQPAAIQLSNGTTTKTVDLSAADSVGDVLNAINAAGVGGITASLSASGGITLAGAAGDNISVSDVGGGTTAADLGISQPNGAGAGVPVNGANLQPRVTGLTPLSALRGGAGINTSGIQITNGQNTKTITITAGMTVEGFLNEINGSGLPVKAQINAAGNGIDILNAAQGTTMSIAENGGTTATDLGLRSFGPTTALTDLNNGAGVRTVSGADFQITRRDGTSFQVDVDGAKTVQDVINAINTADGGNGLTASFATTGNGIVLTDTTSGGGSPKVTPLNFSNAAADLGLMTTPSGNAINGSDVGGVQANGVFSDLQKLISSLQTGDQQGITAAGAALKSDQDQVVKVRAVAGAQVQNFTSRQTQLDNENLATQTLLSNLQDTDFTSTISKFQTLQTALQASLQTTAKITNLSLLDFLT